MDLDFLPEHAEFRKEVRSWIEDNFPKAIRDKQATGEHLNKEEILSWHKILYKKGWLTPSWPVEHGGTGWDAVRKYIFSEELARAAELVSVYKGVRHLVQLGEQYRLRPLDAVS